MKAEWACFPEHIAPESCDTIVEAALRINSEKGSIGHNNHVDTNVRSSEVRWLPRADIDWAELFTAIDSCVRVANKHYFGIDYELSTNFQFSAYKAEDGGHYDRHTDVFWVSDNELDRKLTALVQLSSPTSYAGGVFEFPDCSQPSQADDLRAQGTVLVFPSLFYHIAHPVTQGTRYSMVGWYEGPPWR